MPVPDDDRRAIRQLARTDGVTPACLGYVSDACVRDQGAPKCNSRSEDYVLDPDRRELTRGSEAIAVGPQVFDLLVYLVQNRERVVSKDDLLDVVWGGRIVSESTLTSHINAARKAIGDSGEEQRLIRTVARKGFRFVGDVNGGTHHRMDVDSC